MRKITTAAISVIALGLLSSGPVLAAGLPQLDTTTYTPQVIWLVVTFVVLYFLMAKGALPRITQVLEERQSKIDSNLKKAESLKADADTAAAAFEATMNDARAKGAEVVHGAQARMASEAATRQQELADKLATDIEGAEKRIQAARDTALEGVRDMAAETALAVTERLTGLKLEEKDAADAVDASMKGRS